MGLRLPGDAEKQVGEGGKDFPKGCWKGGVGSPGQKELWGQASRSKGGLSTRQSLEGKGSVGQMEQG